MALEDLGSLRAEVTVCKDYIWVDEPPVMDSHGMEALALDLVIALDTASGELVTATVSLI